MPFKILIVKLGALGDVVRTTFLPKLLKRKYPLCEITWVTHQNATSVLEGNPDIERIFSFNQASTTQLKSEAFDLVYSLDDEKEVCTFVSSLQKKELYGSYTDEQGNCTYTPSVEPWFGMGLLRSESQGGKKRADQLKALNRKTYQEIFVEMLDLKPAMQNSQDTQPVLHVTLEELNSGYECLKKHQLQDAKLIIGINSGAGARWKLKWLSEEKTAQLCDMLVRKLDATVLLLGGLDEAERNRAIQALCEEQVTFIDPVASIRNFAGIINVCDAVVTSDSLALHLSLAMEKKTIAFFGPTSPWEIELFNRGERVFKLSECLCCYRKDCFENSCIAKLTAEDVYNAVKNTLDK